jgi:thymidylate synthase (FAD)
MSHTEPEPTTPPAVPYEEDNTPPPVPANKRLVLDHGAVELLETFGDDLTVVNAARVSYAKESKALTNGDKKLIKFLAEHNHITPFFHPQVRFRIKMPIFVAREWFRHVVGAARNEVSRRYVDFEPECYVPDVVRARDANKKQGSKDEGVVNNEEARDRIKAANDIAMGSYTILLREGVAPEVARIVLPQGMYTEFIETGSLAFYARVCNLRLDPAAQWEIRQYAEAVRELLISKFPVSWEALCRDDTIIETGAAGAGTH